MTTSKTPSILNLSIMILGYFMKKEGPSLVRPKKKCIWTQEIFEKKICLLVNTLFLLSKSLNFILILFNRLIFMHQIGVTF